jgi:hypothetical protein
MALGALCESKGLTNFRQGVLAGVVTGRGGYISVCHLPQTLKT